MSRWRKPPDNVESPGRGKAEGGVLHMATDDRRQSHGRGQQQRQGARLRHNCRVRGRSHVVQRSGNIAVGRLGSPYPRQAAEIR